MPEEEEEKKPFTKVKLTKEQSMSTGASFHASDVMVTAQGARVVLFGGYFSLFMDIYDKEFIHG